MKLIRLNFILAVLMLLTNIHGYSQSTLIHYWHFNSYNYGAMHTYPVDTVRPIVANYSILDTNKAKILYAEKPGTSALYNTFIDSYSPITSDYDTVNPRLGMPSGMSLRVRNPSDSMQLLFYIPTQQYKNIVINYGSQSSSITHGQQHRLFDYSVDSGTTWSTSGLSITSDSAWTVFHRTTVSMASDSTVNNNSRLIFRIKFSGNDTGTSGNNRFDNITVEGDSINTISVMATPNTTICSGAFINFSASATFPFGIIPHYRWKKNGTVVGMDSSSFTTSLLSTGDSVNCQLVNATGDTVFATSGSLIVSVNPLPNAGSISGPSSICVPGTITLSETVTGGTWSYNHLLDSMSGGIVIGKSAGIDTVRYSITNSCGSATVTQLVTLNLIPVVSNINGSSSVCIGNTITLSDTVAGGAWSVSNINCTVIGGVITGVLSGIDTVKYRVTNVCGSDSTYKIITINSSPNAGVITGPNAVCISDSISLFDTVSGGTWGLTNSHATILSSGKISGVSTGIDTITYSKTNICGTTSASKIVSVDLAPNAGSIIGSSSVCVGYTLSLTDSITTGTWNVSNGSASISSGSLTGISVGIDTVVYTVANACGSVATTKSITVNASAGAGAAGTITGDSVVCSGASITLTDTASGGTWNLSNAHATNAGNVVSGASAGIDTLSYTISNSCGSVSVSKVITVNVLGNPGTISGLSNLCTGANITLSETVTTGSWSAVNAHGSVSGGIVTGHTAGTDTILYSVTNLCGTAVDTQIVHIHAMPTAIAGSGSICDSSSSILTDSISGGSWISSTITVATIDSTGNIHALSTGTTTVSYNNAGCIVTKMITVNPLPNAGIVTGNDSICIGSSITLNDSISGGAWSATNANAIVLGGITTGVTTGFDTIKYLVTTASCGNKTATKTVFIRPLPVAGVISGLDSVCIGTTVTLEDSAVSGGTWSINNIYAAIDSFGIVLGNSAGIDTVNYTIINICGQSAVANKVITVMPQPHAGSISGTDSICVAASTTLTNTNTAGTWSTSNGKASISATGIVTGDTAGLVKIIYSVTNYCGTDTVNHTLIIKPRPNAGAISGLDSLCMNAKIVLSETVTNGTWATSNSNVVFIGDTAFGAHFGRDTIGYIVTNSCGSDTAYHIIKVKRLPLVAAITGGDSLCNTGINLTITLTDVVTGGVWTSSDTMVARVAGGLVTGIGSGIDTIHYTVSNSCGDTTTTKVVTVLTLPASPSITGIGFVYVAGVPDTLYGTPSGGVWSSSDTNYAKVNNYGIVTGFGKGTDTIYYTISNYCGSTTTGQVLNVVDYVNLLQLQDGGIRLFPNPSNGKFTIQLPETVNEFAITIFDINGREVASRNYSIGNAFEQTFDLSGVAENIYLIKVSMNKKTFIGNIEIK